MRIPFLNRVQLNKITTATSDEAGLRAHKVLEGLLNDLPELLMSCVVEISSGKVLSSYTTSSSCNPNQISLRNAKLLRTLEEASTTKAWAGGPLTDVSIILEDQLHHIRPFNQGKWYCYLAIRTEEASLGIAKEIVRRHII